MNSKITTTHAKILFPSECVLGESPLWHPARRSCFWVDIEKHRIYEYSWLNKKVKCYDVGKRISLIVRGEGSYLIVGVQGGVGRFNLDTRQLSIITDLSENWQTHRCNDGICDNKGALWISTMAFDHTQQMGCVYRVAPFGLMEKKIAQVYISNGMAWSLDNDHLYYIDSATREVRSYLYNTETSGLLLEKTVVRIPDKLGLPDGMTIDAEGKLWIALFGGYGVGRFDVDTGEMIQFIEIPVAKVTSCAFVGDELDLMLITTAGGRMTPTSSAHSSISGHTFIAKPEVKGVPDFNCAL